MTVASRSQTEASSGRCTILIVDDEPSIKHLLRVMLELNGYHVETACNGKAALELLRSIDMPALILLDLMMPVMNGWEFYEAIKSDPSYRNYQQIPIVLITAYSEDDIEMPPLEILRKPIDTRLLDGIVSRYCIPERRAL
jgi:CheY-like chemotaxis protein